MFGNYLWADVTQALFETGTVAAPSISFIGGNSTGLYLSGGLNISVSGALRGKFSTAGLDVTGALGVSGAGTFGGMVNVPVGGWGTGYSFTGATTSFFGSAAYGGMHVQGQNVLISYVSGGSPSFLKLGLGNATNHEASVEFYTDGSTPTTYNARIVSKAGATGALEIRNVGTGNMELWQEGAGQIRLITSGAQRVAVSAAGDMTQSTGTFTAPIVNTTTTYKRDGIAGGIFIPSVRDLTDSGSSLWNGTLSRTTATYGFDMQTAANGSVPADAVAVVVMMTATIPNTSSYALLAPFSGSYTGVLRGQGSALTNDGTFVIPLGVNGDISVTTAGSTFSNCRLRLIGYFL